MARNCREYCLYSEQCKKYYPNYAGEEGLHIDDCPMAWHIMDRLADLQEYADDEEEQEDDGF